ncbi:MAG: UvrD-helicase domain-containing protein [Anaerolineaceae bacterium]|nr:UvrD-helicase domain-containing protein [Anaerolineaceae bacterium]
MTLDSDMTYGEKRITRLLNSFSKNDYRSFREPYIAADNAFHKPDFVIVSRMSGVVILEVKDWKGIKKFGPKEFVVQHGDGRTEPEPNPILTAEKYGYNLKKRFEDFSELMHIHKGKLKPRFPWLAVGVLPHVPNGVLRKYEERGYWGAGQILGQDDLRTPEQFEEALKRLSWPWKLSQPLDIPTLDIIRLVLGEATEVEDSQGAIIGITTEIQEKAAKEKLRSRPLPPTGTLPEQAENLIDNPTVRLVRGVAGSGKSLVLAKRAQFLAETYPNLNILVLAFNVELVKDLNRRISGASNLDVINFHKMCSRILSRKWRSPQDIGNWLENQAQLLVGQSGMNAEFIEQEIEWRKELEIFNDQEYLEIRREGRGKSLSKAKRQSINIIFNTYNQYHHRMDIVDWSDVPHLALAELLRGHPLRHSYDAILIDEAQDFAPSWLKVVKRLLVPGGSLFMCDDPAQSLFRAYSWKQKGIEVVGRTVRLRVPFRSTQEITQAAYGLLNAELAMANQSDDFTQPDLDSYQLTSGERPWLVEYHDLVQEVGRTTRWAQTLKESGIPADQIAILCHNKRHLKHWASLRQEGFFVDSFNRMKGLEFRAVLIPHIHTAFLQSGQQGDEDHISEMRRRIFTAMTRAREILILSHHAPLPAEFAPLQPYVQLENGKFPVK